MIKSKKQMFIVIGVFTLVMLLGTVTYAFFNYTRTGSPNTIKVGDIYFNSSYDAVMLDGIFPIEKTAISTDTDNVMSVDVDIEGHTTYENGIYYEVKASDVNLTVNGKNIPIGISVSSNNLSNVTLTNYEDGKVLTNDSLFANGRILASDGNTDNSVDGTITIKAYLDRDRIAISDTYNGLETDLMGTTNGWVNGRVVLTTAEWDSLSTTPISFKVKVEAYENDVSTLVDGTTFIGKVKKLANPNLDDSNQSFWANPDNNITTFERVIEKPDTTGFTDGNIISTIDSAYPIYAWYENGVIKYYSKSKNIKANKDMARMFYKLTALNDIEFLAGLDMTNVTSMGGMFFECTAIESLNSLTNWNVSNVTNMGVMFYRTGITSLTPLTNWNVSNVTNMDNMFYGTGITSLSPLANWNVSNVTDMHQVFTNCTGITSLESLSNWNVSNVTNMQSMFYGCTGITSLEPLADWNISNVTEMGAMFSKCTGITSLEPLANWNVSNVIDMYSMFESCTGITSLTPLSSWNVSNVTSMDNMFNGCTGITSLTPLSSWNVSNVTNMHSMFYGCTGITSLEPLADWNISNVTSMSNMFDGCIGITSLTPLANWNVSNLRTMRQMFSGCTALSDASGINDWDITNVNPNAYTYGFREMFKNAPSHPTFTKRAGTWDANGTFTPSA